MKQAILSFGTALILSTVFTALLIPFLKRKHIGQNIREVGPKHQKKAGNHAEREIFPHGSLLRTIRCPC